MRARWLTVVEVLILSSGVLVAQTQSEQDAKAAKLFKTQWSSVQCTKSVVVGNPAIANSQDRSLSESLVLSCQIEIRDPDLVLGTSSEGVITQVKDGNGREIAVTPPTQRGTQTYQPLRYSRRVPKEPWYEAAIRRVLRRPRGQFPPTELVTELSPNPMRLRLDTGVIGQTGGELKSIKGYFHAVVAGTIEHVDVPFEPNNMWVRLTPDLEIQVTEAASTQFTYRYHIDSRQPGASGSSAMSGGGTPMSMLAGRGPLRLTVGEPLPQRIAVSRQFLDPNGNRSVQDVGGPPFIGMVAGTGSAGGNNNVGPVKTIRFLIAVDANEYEIPFEFKNIQLPKLE